MKAFEAASILLMILGALGALVVAALVVYRLA